MPLLGTRRYPQLLRGAFSSPPLSISLPRLAFSAVPSRLLAQHWRLPHLLTSQAAAPGQAEDSYRPASPLITTDTSKWNIRSNKSTLFPQEPRLTMPLSTTKCIAEGSLCFQAVLLQHPHSGGRAPRTCPLPSCTHNRPKFVSKSPFLINWSVLCFSHTQLIQHSYR